jgi:hypothetical protein
MRATTTPRKKLRIIDSNTKDREEGPNMTEEMDKPLVERGVGVGPTSIDVTDEQTSITGIHRWMYLCRQY